MSELSELMDEFLLASLQKSGKRSRFILDSLARDFPREHAVMLCGSPAERRAAMATLAAAALDRMNRISGFVAGSPGAEAESDALLDSFLRRAEQLYAVEPANG